MRYRDNAAEPVGAAVDDAMVFGTAVYALVAGLALCVAGVRTRKYWLASMGAVLIASSSAFLIGRWLGG